MQIIVRTKMEEPTTPCLRLHTALCAGWEKQTETIMLALATRNVAQNYIERTVGGLKNVQIEEDPLDWSGSDNRNGSY